MHATWDFPLTVLEPQVEGFSVFREGDGNSVIENFESWTIDKSDCTPDSIHENGIRNQFSLEPEITLNLPNPPGEGLIDQYERMLDLSGPPGRADVLDLSN